MNDLIEIYSSLEFMNKYKEVKKTFLKKTEVTTDRNFHEKLLQQTASELQIQDKMFYALQQEILGYGIISLLLRHPDISEVLINSPDDIWIENSSGLQKLPLQFFNQEHYEQIVTRLLDDTKMLLSSEIPISEGFLPGNIRVHMCCPPVSLSNIVLSFRKPTRQKFFLSDFYFLEERFENIIRQHVSLKSNIIICGATNSGKTSFLRAILNELKNKERCVVLEDTVELFEDQENRVHLKTSPARTTDEQNIGLTDLINTALRLRPDRIILGECRGSEASALLLALQSGHKGCITTLHAGSTKDAFSRLAVCGTLKSSHLDYDTFYRLVKENIDCVVYLEKEAQCKFVVKDVWSPEK